MQSLNEINKEADTFEYRIGSEDVGTCFDILGRSNELENIRNAFRRAVEKSLAQSRENLQFINHMIRAHEQTSGRGDTGIYTCQNINSQFRDIRRQLIEFEKQLGGQSPMNISPEEIKDLHKFVTRFVDWWAEIQREIESLQRPPWLGIGERLTRAEEDNRLYREAAEPVLDEYRDTACSRHDPSSSIWRRAAAKIKTFICCCMI